MYYIPLILVHSLSASKRVPLSKTESGKMPCERQCARHHALLLLFDIYAFICYGRVAVLIE